KSGKERKGSACGKKKEKKTGKESTIPELIFDLSLARPCQLVCIARAQLQCRVVPRKGPPTETKEKRNDPRAQEHFHETNNHFQCGMRLVRRRSAPGRWQRRAGANLGI